MAAPSNKPAFDLAIAKKAAQNFNARKKQRDAKAKAMDAGDYLKAETAVRLAKRVNHLMNAYSLMPPLGRSHTGRGADGSPKSPLGLKKEAGVEPEMITNQFVERVINETRDFLAVGFFDKGATASRAVGRIVTRLSQGRNGLGTGFLVTPSLLITNHHVLDSENTARKSVVEFNYQLSVDGEAVPIERFDLLPDKFFLTDSDLDFALVAVAPESQKRVKLTDFGYCPLLGAEGKILVQDPVNIVQHPRGEFKQIAIRENKLLDLPEGPPLDKFAHYETDTEQGSSGSPVFNDQWEVIALHHSSVPRINAQNKILDRKGNVWPEDGDPNDIDWISNEGIRTSRLVSFIKNVAVRPHEMALREEFMKTTVGGGSPQTKPDNKGAAAPKPLRGARVESQSGPGEDGPRGAPTGTVSLTIPLTLTLSVGSTTAGHPLAGVVTPVESLGDTFESAISPDPDYTDRPGFNPNFLGFDVPLPILRPETSELALTVDDGIELKYYHYSVIMNKQRKLAFVSAVNFDGGSEFHVAREGGDRWFYDPRIDRDQQTGPKLYANNPLDRGHLTRRADAAWGADEEDAQRSNDDTFHWTNCSPQHEVFNQSTKANQRGVLLWGNLENHVAEQANGGKLSIFNGPIFRANDRVHRDVKIPREFYKVIAYVKDNGSPGAVAFILSQQSLISNLPAEEFDVGPYQPYQVKIGALQDRIKLDFPTLVGIDALNQVGRERFLEGATTALFPIDRMRDIVL